MVFTGTVSSSKFNYNFSIDPNLGIHETNIICFKNWTLHLSNNSFIENFFLFRLSTIKEIQTFPVLDKNYIILTLIWRNIKSRIVSILYIDKLHILLDFLKEGFQSRIVPLVDVWGFEVNVHTFSPPWCMNFIITVCGPLSWLVFKWFWLQF